MKKNRRSLSLNFNHPEAFGVYDVKPHVFQVPVDLTSRLLPFSTTESVKYGSDGEPMWFRYEDYSGFDVTIHIDQGERT